MKVYICRTSGAFNSGYIKKCENFEECCESLLKTEDYGNFERYLHELIIRKPDKNSPFDEKEKECDWVIEIYDDYRE